MNLSSFSSPSTLRAPGVYRYQPGARRWRRWIVRTVLAMLMMALTLWVGETFHWQEWLKGLHWLRIEEVNVTSEWPVTPAMVRTWLPALEGRNLLFVQPDRLMRLLEQKPWVENVLVKKVYPTRLLIEVGTKRPQAVALLRGLPYFLDADGQTIERATPPLLRALDLTIVSGEKETDFARWDSAEVIRLMERLRRALDYQYDISQIVLSSPPFFKVYFSRPHVEVSLSIDNWETQIPILALLLHSPPRQIGQPRKINLVFPKKAVVSPPLSH
jgi:cell division septal protein FtsQ